MSFLTDPQDAHFWIMIALVVFGAVLWRANVHKLAGKVLDDAGAKVQAQLDEAQRLRELGALRAAQFSWNRTAERILESYELALAA